MPGAVSRAARDIDRKMRKGERSDTAEALKASTTSRTVGAHGARSHKKGAPRRLKHDGPVTGVYCDARNAAVCSASA